MKILVFGNVGAGKSTIVAGLREILQWQVVSIDAYRKEFGDGSTQKETLAQQHFFGALSDEKNQIIESLGVGKVSEKLFSILVETEEKVLCVIILAPKDICKNRVQNRDDVVPFAKDHDEVYPLIDKTDARIANFEIEKMWGNRKNTNVVRFTNLTIEDKFKIVFSIISIVNE